jgi:hypothetical protein
MNYLRGIDVSEHQLPRLMRYAEWRARYGLRYGLYRLTIGNRLDSAGLAHRAAMRAAGYATGAYGVPHEVGNQADQARLFLDNLPDDELAPWFDAERKFLTEPMLARWCDTYDERTNGAALDAYTGKPWWDSHVPPERRARYARYGLAIAAYPFDRSDYDENGNWQGQPMDPISIALRSTPPPPSRAPLLPAPWTAYRYHQHTGHGSLDGYASFLDLSVFSGTEADLLGAAPVPDAAATELAARARAIVGLVG